VVAFLDPFTGRVDLMDVDRVLLAIDGGQTATKALIARADGTVLGGGLGGPSDHFHIEGGVEKNRRAIVGAIDAALATTGCPPEQIVAAGLGLTGASSRAPEMVEEMVRERISPRAITVVADYVTNLAGASGGKPGVVLIAGGGAIGYGVTAEGDEAIAGGYGFLLGDEGSAFKIGLRAIAAACRGADFRDQPTVLTDVVVEYFEVDRVRELPRIIYAAGFSRERISLLAPRVVQAADAGDAAAIEIMQDAGEELARTALGVMRQLFVPGTEVAVYMTGGVFKSGTLLLDPFRSRLHQEWPEADPREPRFPPAVGALIMAAQSAGIAVDEVWLDKVEATLDRTA
jgi:N-acetylglucosamine kinase-like BadF-type ATPase